MPATAAWAACDGHVHVLDVVDRAAEDDGVIGDRDRVDVGRRQRPLQLRAQVFDVQLHGDVEALDLAVHVGQIEVRDAGRRGRSAARAIGSPGTVLIPRTSSLVFLTREIAFFVVICSGTVPPMGTIRALPDVPGIWAVRASGRPRRTARAADPPAGGPAADRVCGASFHLVISGGRRRRRPPEGYGSRSMSVILSERATVRERGSICLDPIAAPLRSRLRRRVSAAS